MFSLNELVSQVDGPIRRPDDTDYDAERSGFQAAYRHQPSVVVGATTVDDVRAAVRYAAENDLPVAVQATGHGLAVPTEGGVLITTRRMSGTRIDPTARTARIAAGTLWGEVVNAAAAHGLAPLSGSSSDVGAVGYTLGGGLGVLSREFGYAADHLRSVELVTADATVRQVDDAHDLHWALAGAGGNFGIATSAEIGLVPVSRLYGGGLYFDTAQVPAALEAYRTWVDTVPEQLTSSIALIPIPDLPMVPEPLRGRYVAHIRVAFTGDTELGERLVAPLRAIGPRLIDTLAEMPYTESPSIYNDPTQPHGYYGTNAMLDTLDAGVPATVLDLVGPDSPVPCVVQINHLGGALARPPAVPNAVAHRDAAFLLRVLSVVNGPTPSIEHAAPTLLTDALKPWTIGRSPNFVFGERSTPEQAQTCYRPEDFRRLAALKATYDPTNMFRCNVNIPPSQAARSSHLSRPVSAG